MVVSTLCFRLEIPFLATLFGQIWSKKSKWSVLAENWYKNNTNMTNSMVIFIFSCFCQKYPFLEICSVTQNSLKL